MKRPTYSLCRRVPIASMGVSLPTRARTLARGLTKAGGNGGRGGECKAPCAIPAVSLIVYTTFSLTPRVMAMPVELVFWLKVDIAVGVAMLAATLLLLRRWW